MKKQLALLNKLGASPELVISFKEVCGINDALPPDQKADFATLLEEQCRKFGFHDILPDGWFFRPYGCSGEYHRQDGPITSDASEAPAIEQAYRRGVAQGFAICRGLVPEKIASGLVKSEKRIDAWRNRAVQRFGSQPGDEERPPRKLFGGRYSLSAKMRWAVFQRDDFQCVACGCKAGNGRTLEVDHKTPVSKGGFDCLENLQTLCDLCNRGKADK